METVTNIFCIVLVGRESATNPVIGRERLG
jgi:hypothetical protein